MAGELLNEDGLNQAAAKIPVGISSCLLGDRVRYDGGHKANGVICETLGEYFEFRKFCPELDIGLGVPRKPIRLTRRDSGEIRCLVIDDSTKDHTDALTQCANAQQHWHEKLCGYVLKSNSPSCGMERVKIWEGDSSVSEGIGLYAAQLMKNFPYLPVEEEGRLEDSSLRENFIQRVFVMRAWHQLIGQGLTVAGLRDFHARQVLAVMSQDQMSYRRLGEIVLATKKDNLQENGRCYLLHLMRAIATSAGGKKSTD